MAALGAVALVATATGEASVGDAAFVGAKVFGGLALAYVLGTFAYFLYATMGKTSEEREAAGENDFLTWCVYQVTPSPWRKTYFDKDNQNAAERTLLDLPTWQPDEARALTEPECVVGVQAMRQTTLELPVAGVSLDACYWSAKPANPLDAPPVMMIHGFDSSVLEFRFMLPELVEAGLEVHACDWWTGGFTQRKPGLDAIEANPALQPWDIIREQNYAFWKQQLGGRPVVLCGYSLGGAAAIDFAVAHPEAVAALILVDAGGESYAQPPPALTAVSAQAVANFFAWRGDAGILPFPHLHQKMPYWRDALAAFLQSGGFQSQVGPERISLVPQKTLVLWGEADDVLPVEDAYEFEKDLPDCVGVRLIPSAQHAPGLENPAAVVQMIEQFAVSVGKGEPTLPAPPTAVSERSSVSV